MFANSKSQWIAIALSLLTLRLVIGWHFYMEGVTKLKSGDFSAEPFFRSAKGPLAGIFQKVIPDQDGRLRLGLVATSSDESDGPWDLDPLVTEQLWKGFAYRTARIRGYGDPQLVERLSQRRSELQSQLARAQAARADVGTVADLQDRLAEVNASLNAIRQQKSDALLIVDRYVAALGSLLEENKPEILAYFRGAERTDGFDRDGPHQSAVVAGVSSLRSQTESINAERSRNVREWLTEVDAMWAGVEADINALAIQEQGGRFVPIDAPQKSWWSPLPWINAIVPWFDAIVGGLLILGLFTRLASLAGAMFLVSIIATQPPWVAGAASTTYQFIEVVGLFVLYACHAGRYAGLDFFRYERAARRRMAVREPLL